MRYFIEAILITISMVGIAIAYEYPLVVVVPSYNNSAWYDKNLESIFSQKYENYRVIYIDDCSTDGTYALVEKAVHDAGQEHRVTLVRNKKRQGALANHYKAVWMCDDDEIILQMDGDDWFAHDEVFAKINTVYQDPDVWITYGQYEVWPSKKAGIAKSLSQGTIRKVAYRESEWVTSALRTFKAGLFKHIQLQDLINNGVFFQTTCDFAFMLPMLEMADGRAKFIDEVLYIYNCKTQFNDYKRNLQQQLATEYFLRSRSKYKPLDSVVLKKEMPCVEMIVFYQGNKAALLRLLACVNGLITGLDKITLFTDAEYVDSIPLIQKQYPDIACIVTHKNNFKTILTDHVIHTVANHIMCVVDTEVVVKHIDVTHSIAVMQKSGAYCFAYCLGKNITTSLLLNRMLKQPPILDYDGDTCVWQFKDAEYDWANPHRLSMMLYKKEMLQQILSEIQYDSYSTCKTAFERYPFNRDMIGLCYKHSCITQIGSDNIEQKTLHHYVIEHTIERV